MSEKDFAVFVERHKLFAALAVIIATCFAFLIVSMLIQFLYAFRVWFVVALIIGIALMSFVIGHYDDKSKAVPL